MSLRFLTFTIFACHGADAEAHFSFLRLPGAEKRGTALPMSPIIEPHQFIRDSVHTHQACQFAEWMAVAPSTIQKWWRSPETDENPNGTGRRSFLEMTDRFFDWLLLHQPARAVLFLKRYESRLERFRDSAIAGNSLTRQEFSELLAAAILRSADALAAIARQAEPPVLWREHGAAVQAVESLIHRLMDGQEDAA